MYDREIAKFAATLEDSALAADVDDLADGPAGGAVQVQPESPESEDKGEAETETENENEENEEEHAHDEL